jgi:hypothetical protein
MADYGGVVIIYLCFTQFQPQIFFKEYSFENIFLASLEIFVISFRKKKLGRKFDNILIHLKNFKGNFFVSFMQFKFLTFLTFHQLMLGLPQHFMCTYKFCFWQKVVKRQH